MRPFFLVLLLPVLLALAACGEARDTLKQVDRPVGNLYNDAFDKLENHDYKRAADQFDEVERQHPYSQWATKASVMSAYSQYAGLHYEAALKQLDSFIQLHPGNKDIAYAYYLKALCSYEQIGDVRRDITSTNNALVGFEDVIRRFPDSAYAKASQAKINLVRDRLAAKEMEIGRYYEQRENYIAAIGRFRDVVENYQTTSHTPEALLRLTECYHALGLDKEAKENASVLGYNYPGSDWYKDAYALISNGAYQAPHNDQPSWLDQVLDSFF